MNSELDTKNKESQTSGGASIGAGVDIKAGDFTGRDSVNNTITVPQTQDNAQLLIIVEACQAGKLIQGRYNISKSGRIIITSTNDHLEAYASRNGAYFSDSFLNALGQGHNFFYSFNEARDIVETISRQDPWLDANGNGKPNEPEDWNIASKRGFAYDRTVAESNSPPFITQMTGTTTVGKGTGTIQAEVRDDREIDHVWAVVYPPSYAPSENTTGEWIDEELQVLDLQKTGDDLYTTEIVFGEIGEYRIVIHAEDDKGLLARPEALMFDVDTVSPPTPTPSSSDGGF